MRQFFFKHRGLFMIPLALLVFFFGKPTAASFSVGLIVAVLGELLRVWGVGYAGKTTRGDKVEAPFLVTAGPFAFVRNPLYIGNGTTGLGFTIIACGATSPVVTAILFILWFLFYFTVYGVIIPHEEEFLQKTFGEPYTEYCKHVKRILPRLLPYAKAQGTFRWEPVIAGEWQTLILFAVLTVVLLLKMPGMPLFGKLFFS